MPKDIRARGGSKVECEADSTDQSKNGSWAALVALIQQNIVEQGHWDASSTRPDGVVLVLTNFIIEVFQNAHTGTHARKVSPPGDPEKSAALMREANMNLRARCVKQLVKILRGVGHDRTTWSSWIVMEYMRMLNIEELNDRLEGLPIQSVACFVWDIAQAIRGLHGLNIAHCDLKSANCYMDVNHSYKLGDLGAAAIMEFGKKRSTYVGTPHESMPIPPREPAWLTSLKGTLEAITDPKAREELSKLVISWEKHMYDRIEADYRPFGIMLYKLLRPLGIKPIDQLLAILVEGRDPVRDLYSRAELIVLEYTQPKEYELLILALKMARGDQEAFECADEYVLKGKDAADVTANAAHVEETKEVLVANKISVMAMYDTTIEDFEVDLMKILLKLKDQNVHEAELENAIYTGIFNNKCEACLKTLSPLERSLIRKVSNMKERRGSSVERDRIVDANPTLSIIFLLEFFTRAELRRVEQATSETDDEIVHAAQERKEIPKRCMSLAPLLRAMMVKKTEFEEQRFILRNFARSTEKLFWKFAESAGYQRGESDDLLIRLRNLSIELAAPIAARKAEELKYVEQCKKVVEDALEKGQDPWSALRNEEQKKAEPTPVEAPAPAAPPVEAPAPTVVETTTDISVSKTKPEDPTPTEKTSSGASEPSGSEGRPSKTFFGVKGVPITR